MMVLVSIPILVLSVFHVNVDPRAIYINPDGSITGLNANNTDNYPLMGTFNLYPVPVYGHPPQSYNVTIISNSTITGFLTPISRDTPYPEVVSISFNVTGKQGSAIFCRISVPAIIMNATFQVSVNNTSIPYTMLPCSNANVSYLYFTYNHSTGQVTILPEFSSLLILPLLLTITTLAVAIHRKKLPKTCRT